MDSVKKLWQQGSVLILLFTAINAFGQSNDFLITGKFKVDGGSNNGARIVLEKDGRKVRTLDGDSRFEVKLDYQAIYIVSFEKDGYVTKKLRFDTHVPEERIEYGFEPFDFTVEIFEQFDDVNVVVFNQPVGKISYSDIIDEFDYDTDYTKSIQTQIQQVMEEVEVKKEEKAEAEAQAAKEEAKKQQQIENLTSAAEKSLKSGEPEEALKKLEEAAQLSDSPEIQAQIKEAQAQVQQQQEQKQQQAEFDQLVADAEAMMAAGDLEGAKKKFLQAQGVMEGDKKVADQLSQIEQTIQQQAEQEESFKQMMSAAEAALQAGNFNEAVKQAEAAQKIKADPALDELIAKANEGMAAEAAAEAAAAQAEEEFEALISKGEEAEKAGNWPEAIAAYEEAKQLKPEAAQDERISGVMAKQEQEEAAKAAEAAKEEQVAQLLADAQAALESGDLEQAQALASQAEALKPGVAQAVLDDVDARQKELASAQAEEEKRRADFDQLMAAGNEARDNGDLAGAKEKYEQARDILPDEAAAIEALNAVEELIAQNEAAAAEAAEKAAAQQEAFESLISEGEAALNAGDLATARSKYEEAQAIGEDKRITTGLKEVAKKEADLAKEAEEKAKLQADFDAAIAAGDEAMASGDLLTAEKKFTEAQSLQDNELVQAKLTALDEAVEKREAELAAMNAAEQEAARKAEEEAAKLAAEKEAAEKAAAEDAEKLAAEQAEQEAERLAAEQAAKEAEERAKEQDALVAKGDKAFEKEEYDEALASYNAALNIGPSDRASAQISSIQEIKAQQAAAMNEAERAAEEARIAKAIDEFVKTGEAALNAGSYDAAIEAFNGALSLREDDAIRAKLEEATTKRDNARKEEQLAQSAAQDDERYATALKQADALFQGGKLKEARDAYRAAALIKNDPVIDDRIAQIDKILADRAAAEAASKEAAQAISSGPRESNELAEIITQESEKQDTRVIEQPSPEIGTRENVVKRAVAVMEQDTRPGQGTVAGVIVSEPVVGEKALQTNAAKLSEEDKYDGVMNQVESDYEEMEVEAEQRRLIEKYPERKTVETEKEGNSVITYVYINRGDFVTVYKKVEHSWGGKFYFIDERPTNQRFWEHETQ